MRLERRLQALRLRRSALSTSWSERSPISALALLPNQRSGSRLCKALTGARRFMACLRMRLPSTRTSPRCARPRGSALRPNHRRTGGWDATAGIQSIVTITFLRRRGASDAHFGCEWLREMSAASTKPSVSGLVTQACSKTLNRDAGKKGWWPSSDSRASLLSSMFGTAARIAGDQAFGGLEGKTTAGVRRRPAGLGESRGAAGHPAHRSRRRRGERLSHHRWRRALPCTGAAAPKKTHPRG